MTLSLALHAIAAAIVIAWIALVIRSERPRPVRTEQEGR